MGFWTKRIHQKKAELNDALGNVIPTKHAEQKWITQNTFGIQVG